MKKRIHKYYNTNTLEMFDQMLEGILILDENTVVEFVNKSYLEFSGLRYDQIIGLEMNVARPGAISREVFKRKVPEYNYHRIHDPLHESYVDVIPIMEKDEVIGGLIVLRDIKVLKNLFTQIQDRDKRILQLSKHMQNVVYKAKFTFSEAIGTNSPHWRTAINASKVDSSVLLLGESGTGKEVIAQSIHNGSIRHNRPFVDVNCAALPESLLESELFGYSPGAFTGADKNGKIGLFELANGGTIFLDEITEMPLALQSKLLRVLQEKEVRRLGGTEKIHLDVRVIAASNQNVSNMLVKGTFREDLFYRLAVVIINIPPLRERKQDILEHIRHLILQQEQRKKIKYKLTDEVKHLMLNYSWPGNVRQLQNAIEYSCMVAVDGLISSNKLPYYVVAQNNLELQSTKHSHRRPKESLSDTMNRIEKKILTEMLEQYGTSVNTKKEIAEVLGISLSTLYGKLNKLRLLE